MKFALALSVLLATTSSTFGDGGGHGHGHAGGQGGFGGGQGGFAGGQGGVGHGGGIRPGGQGSFGHGGQGGFAGGQGGFGGGQIGHAGVGQVGHAGGKFFFVFVGIFKGTSFLTPSMVHILDINTHSTNYNLSHIHINGTMPQAGIDPQEVNITVLHKTILLLQFLIC